MTTLTLTDAQMIQLLNQSGGLIRNDALVYAQGRLHQTRQGDRWVHVTAFADAAVAQGSCDTLALQRLYDAMLKAGGEFVFGGDMVPDGDPVLAVIPGGAS